MALASGEECRGFEPRSCRHLCPQQLQSRKREFNMPDGASGWFSERPEQIAWDKRDNRFSEERKHCESNCAVSLPLLILRCNENRFAERDKAKGTM